MKILVPIDVFGCADAVIDRALWLADRVDGRVTLLACADTAPLHGGTGADAVTAEARALLDGFARTARARGRLDEVVLAHGAPAAVILAAVAERRPDLLVMGTHGRSGLRRALFGSVAEEVLRKAHVPVLVVPAGVDLPEQPSDAQLQAESESMG